MKKNSLLIICQRLPYPPRRGDQLAISKMINFCHQRGINTKVAVCSSFNTELVPSNLQKTIKFERVRFSLLALFLNILKHPLDPIQVQIFAGYKVKKSDIYAFSKIYIHSIRMSRVIKSTLFSSSFLGAQIDFASEFWERAVNSSGVMRTIYLLESWLLNRYQRNILGRFRLVFRVTAEEFKDFQIENLETFPHGIDPKRVEKVRCTFRGKKKGQSRLKIGFWGNFGFRPNIEAYENLVAWKKISKRNDTIIIFGKGSEKFTPTGLDIKILGEVDDIDLHIDQCDVIINLIQTGGGFQNKTIEAWARGIPVIGYWQAFRGLADVDPIKIVVRDEKDIDAALHKITKKAFRVEYTHDWLIRNWNQETLTRDKLIKMGLR